LIDDDLVLALQLFFGAGIVAKRIDLAGDSGGDNVENKEASALSQRCGKRVRRVMG